VGSYDDAVERLSHAAHGREAAVTAELIRSSRKAEGAAMVSHRSYPKGVAFTWRPYRVIGDTNPTAVAWITVRVVGGEDFSAAADPIRSVTVPWRLTHSDSLSVLIEGNFSLNFIW
jgi:hypothetical protein